MSNHKSARNTSLNKNFGGFHRIQMKKEIHLK